jgi:hypothetical protein
MVRENSKLSMYGALSMVLSLSACSQGSGVAAVASEPPVASIESALEDPISDCQDEQTACLSAAADRAAAVQCGLAFRECLGGAAESGPQLAEALQQCREKAAECAVQGGATGAAACRDELEACVSAASSGGAQPPAADAGAPQDPQPPAAGDSADPASAGAPSVPGIPGVPGLPGRGLPGRGLPFAGAGGFGAFPTLPRPGFPGAGSIAIPSAAGRGGLPGRRGAGATACYEALRACAEAPNADLNQCANTARECVRGGGPLGAAGAGGVAGTP